jgi:alpha-tubulin suppressor-like RCC1 family protein
MGDGHTMVVTADGRVRTCGHGSSRSIHGMTADVDVYTWGSGGCGALGHRNWEDKLVLTKLDCEHFRGSQVMVMSPGFFHSVEVTAEGELFSWGRGGCCIRWA